MKRPEKNAPSFLVQVGVITSAHGIRGQVKLRSFTQTPDAIFAYAPLTDKSGKRQFSLKRDGYKDQLFIATVEGIDTRGGAESLKGTELYAMLAKTPPAGENQWLYSDLEGLQARLEDGSPYGAVTGVYNFGAGDIIDIERMDGLSEMLPFSKEFVGEVKPDEGFLVVFPPDYVEARTTGAKRPK